MKQTISEQALTLVEKKISDLKGQLTPQDAATATGVTVDEAQGALSRLMELYVTRVSYDNNGNLLFAFEMPLRRRGTKTAAERWAEVKESLWRGFKVFFKIWIGLMVIVYFALMIVLLLALMLAQSSSRDDRDRDDRGGNMVGGLLRVLAEGLRFAFWSRAMSPGYYYGTDEYGYRHREMRTPRGVTGKEKSFIIAIYDLALGPERAPSDPLENEREVAAYLREERGVLTPAEIVALSGGTIADAEERMADYLVRFKGDPTITEEGVVVGEFDSFLLGKEAAVDGKVVPYWDEYEAPFEHSGNSTTRNVLIIGMVLFTFVVGIAMLGGGLATLGDSYGISFLNSGIGRFLIGYMPVAFSLVYMLIALVRLPAIKKKDAERLERNRKKRVMRAIFQQSMWRATADQIYFSMLSAGDKDLKKDEVDGVLQKLVIDLGGDLELGENGEAVYNFDRLRRENEAVEKMRGRQLGE